MVHPHRYVGLGQPNSQRELAAQSFISKVWTPLAAMYDTFIPRTTTIRDLQIRKTLQKSDPPSDGDSIIRVCYKPPVPKEF